MTDYAIICGAGYVAGKEIMVLELAQGLAERDRSVHLVVSSWNDGDFSRRLTEAKLAFKMLPIGFISITLTLACMRMTLAQIIRWPRLLRGYRDFLRTIRPRKVIHTNWHHLLLLSPFLRPNRDLFWLHEVVPNQRHYRIVFQFLTRRLQCFVAVSHAVSESLQRLGIPDHKIRMIHNGLTDPTGGVERPSVSNGTLRLGIAGQIGAWKGHDDLLDAFGIISPQWPTAELHIFGQGSKDYERQLRQRTTELDIADRVKWHGFVTDRGDIFGSVEIFVVPSRFEEPLATVAIEASAFGLPVVATRRGGLPEIVEDGVTGILVPSENPARLAEAIQRLLADPNLRHAMGARARQQMVEHFSSERFIRDFLTLLESSPSPS